MLDTRRGATYFADLSRGERWRIVLDLVIAQVGRPGVIPIPQEAWEGLDEINRRDIAQQLEGSGVIALTAECSADEEVTAEVFGG